MRPTTAWVWSSSASSAGDSGSSRPSSARLPGGLMPASAAIAPTVAGESPDRTFSSTPSERRNATVSGASGRSRSASVTRPSGA